MEAKRHYQNAVTAIAKSDWQTAKNELLDAEKLAPENALVHYDLAVAYSHTGSPKSAQAELTKGLQLGLPAEQKHAAKQLKQQLASQTNTTSGSNTKQASSYGASVAEILEWVKYKVESESFSAETTAGDNGWRAVTQRSFRIEHIEGCHFTLVEKTSVESNMADNGVKDTTRYKIDLSQVKSEAKIELFKEQDAIQQTILAVDLETKDPDTPITTTTTRIRTIQTPGFPDSQVMDSKTDWVSITFPSSDTNIAKRVGKALSDAIEKCAGKKVKELY